MAGCWNDLLIIKHNVEITIGYIDIMLKWQIDEMMDWWNDGLMKWWIDEMMDWWNDGLMKWRNNEILE